MSSEPSHRKDYPQLRKSPGWPSSREGVTCTRGSFSLNQRGVYVTAEGLTASVEEANRRRLPTVWFQLLFHSGKGKTVETAEKVRSHRGRGVGVEGVMNRWSPEEFREVCALCDAVMVNACPCALVIY